MPAQGGRLGEAAVRRVVRRAGVVRRSQLDERPRGVRRDVLITGFGADPPRLQRPVGRVMRARRGPRQFQPGSGVPRTVRR